MSNESQRTKRATFESHNYQRIVSHVVVARILAAYQSRHSEKKIDYIGDRLASIETYLKQSPAIATPLLDHDGSTQGEIAASEHTVPNGLRQTTASPLSEHQTLFSGDCDATANTHSTAASNAVERVLSTDSVIGQNPALASALRSLKAMLGNINDKPSDSDAFKSHWTSRLPERASHPSRIEVYKIIKAAGGECMCR